MKRRVAQLTAITVLAAACGAVGPIGADTTTSTAGQTTTTVGTTAGEPTTSAPSPTSTAPASTTTSAPGASSTTPTTQSVAASLAVAPWFYVDEAGHPSRSGPFLMPVARTVPYTSAVGRASLEALFAGPSPGEKAGFPAISTAIPDDVEVLGLTIREGIATVDVSKEFAGTDNSPNVAQRMGQVVFTLTSIPHVNEVLFRQEGSPISAQTGDGQLVSRPVLKADYLELAAVITVEQPVFGGHADDPMRVTGFAAVFEAVFQYALTDGDGLIIAEGQAMSLNGTGWGGFDFSIDYDVDTEQLGALIVWADSAEDGSRIDIREYPVWLTP